MPQETYRPKNECDRCGYTWHPRGKDRSLRCPSCSSSKNISYYVPSNLPIKLFLGGVLSLIIAFTIAGNTSKENEFATNMTGLFGIIGLVGAGLGSMGLSSD